MTNLKLRRWDCFEYRNSYGSEYWQGENARMACFVGAIAIADMVKTTLGPKGMDKILQSVKGSVGWNDWTLWQIRFVGWRWQIHFGDKWRCHNFAVCSCWQCGGQGPGRYCQNARRWGWWWYYKVRVCVAGTRLVELNRTALLCCVVNCSEKLKS